MPQERREHEPAASPATYLFIYVLLLLLLALTIGLSFVDFGRDWNNLAALLIAVTKAVLIVLFFMHLRYGPRLTWVFAAAGFVWLGIMFALTMTDYLSRNHPPGDSAKGEPHFLHESSDAAR
jgi:cytochrome c oxidase subunit 4